MSKSNELSLADTRRLLRAQGELAEFAPGSLAWRQRIVEQVMSLIPTQLVFLAELEEFRAKAEPRTRGVVAAGWLNERAQREFQIWTSDRATARTNPTVAAMTGIQSRLFARRRVEIVDDHEWYRSPIVNTLYRVSEVDDNLTSIYRIDAQGWIIGLGLHRAQGDRSFTERERRILYLFTGCWAPAYARTTATPHLPRRLAEILALLLDGLGEKQIAFRLGLSRHTVHDYVKDLYRRMGVGTRAELMLKCWDRAAAPVAPAAGAGV